MKRALAILLVLVAMISAVFAMGGKESGSVNESGYKDTIKIAIGADVTSFDPHIGKETPAVAVTNHIYDTLVRVDDAVLRVGGPGGADIQAQAVLGTKPQISHGILLGHGHAPLSTRSNFQLGTLQTGQISGGASPTSTKPHTEQT